MYCNVSISSSGVCDNIFTRQVWLELNLGCISNFFIIRIVMAEILFLIQFQIESLKLAFFK